MKNLDKYVRAYSILKMQDLIMMCDNGESNGEVIKSFLLIFNALGNNPKDLIEVLIEEKVISKEVLIDLHEVVGCSDNILNTTERMILKSRTASLLGEYEECEKLRKKMDYGAMKVSYRFLKKVLMDETKEAKIGSIDWEVTDNKLKSYKINYIDSNEKYVLDRDEIILINWN